MTGNVVRLIKRLQRKPAVLISASAIGWYGARGDETADRSRRAAGRRSASASAPTGSARPCRPSASACAWCGCASGSCSAPRAACWRRLLIPFEYGLGGPIGSGRQWMSWIARDDLVRLIAARDRQAGAHRPGQRDRARAGAQRDLHARAWPRACIARPCCACRPRRCAGSAATGRGTAARRPARRPRQGAASSGFVFRHANLRAALAAILGGATEATIRCGMRCRTFRRRLPKSKAFRAARRRRRADRVNLLRLDPSGPVISYAAINRSAGQRRRG